MGNRLNGASGIVLAVALAAGNAAAQTADSDGKWDFRGSRLKMRRPPNSRSEPVFVSFSDCTDKPA